VLDYHLRKGMDLQTVERWLGPYLNYDPGAEKPASGAGTARPNGAIACSCGREHVKAG
jgi:hypothetical protein